MSDPIFGGASELRTVVLDAIGRARAQQGGAELPSDIDTIVRQALDFSDTAIRSPLVAAWSAAMTLADLAGEVLEGYAGAGGDPAPVVVMLREALKEWIREDWQHQIDTSS
jgi:hypothetical protein